MISLEAYRSCIGSFAFSAQLNLKSITKTYVIDSIMSTRGVSRLLKPAPFLALFVFFTYAYPKTKFMEELKVNTCIPLNYVFAFKNMFIAYPQSHLTSELFLSYLKTNYTLLLSGDIELNPGPPNPSSSKCDSAIKILKFVQGNFNQGDERFHESRGIQCSCMTIVSICMTKVRKPTIWKELDLDFVLTQGDNLFKSTGINRMLYSDELPKVFDLENSKFVIEFPRTDDKFISDEGKLAKFIDKDFFFLSEISGAIIFLKDYCISVLKEKKSLFVFDSHSRDKNGTLL